MNDATQMGDVKTLLAPCLNWEAVLRSMFLLIKYPIGRHFGSSHK